ncbi:MAG: 50S ribosomal protein L11 methyltransferase [Enterobacterales bacterium]|nr:50S ribosomal protein L11 methyltransferase [Enterobacterales bacterium]
MPWMQMTLTTNENQVDSVGDAMLALGALSVTLMDAEDVPILEPAPGETPLWDQVKMMFLFDMAIDPKQVLHQWQLNSLAKQTDHIKFELLEDKDWEREWMERFEPMRFGQRLWICPSWKPLVDPAAVNILLDPGLAFGTGTHPTTALCLEWLDSIDLKGKTLIDYGCGSGILAIAALKLGASKVVAVDIDPQALIATRENASRNQIDMQKLVVDYPEKLPDEAVDIVIANILAGPLKELSNIITKHCKINGQIALSGILDTQAEETRKVYQRSFDMESISYKNEWSRLVGTKIHSTQQNQPWSMS